MCEAGAGLGWDNVGANVTVALYWQRAVGLVFPFQKHSWFENTSFAALRHRLRHAM